MKRRDVAVGVCSCVPEKVQIKHVDLVSRPPSLLTARLQDSCTAATRPFLILT